MYYFLVSGICSVHLSTFIYLFYLFIFFIFLFFIFFISHVDDKLKYTPIYWKHTWYWALIAYQYKTYTGNILDIGHLLG